MIEIEKYLTEKKAFVFKFDNVLYPEKDYLLQVYYLFAEFMSYTEQLDAGQVIAFMQKEYLSNGNIDLFEKTAARFDIHIKYKDNFLLLHQNARLPLKLLLYQQILQLLQELTVERKLIFLLVDGDPVQQLNKIKQVEWHGLEQYLKVYFAAEFAPPPSSSSIDSIKNEYNLSGKDMVMIGNDLTDSEYASILRLEFLPISKLI